MVLDFTTNVTSGRPWRYTEIGDSTVAMWILQIVNILSCNVL